MKLKELYPLIYDGCPVHVFTEDDEEICEGIATHDGSFEKFMGTYLDSEVSEIDRCYGGTYEGEIIPETIGIMITVKEDWK